MLVGDSCFTVITRAQNTWPHGPLYGAVPVHGSFHIPSYSFILYIVLSFYIEDVFLSIHRVNSSTRAW